MLYLAIARFRRDEAGATAIEYGLIAALIAVALLSSLAVVGTNLETLYSGGTGSAAAAMAKALADNP